MSKDEFATDFAALGLDFQSPFDILSEPLATPKPQRVRIRKPRDHTAKTIASLRDSINTETTAPADKTQCIQRGGI